MDDGTLSTTIERLIGVSEPIQLLLFYNIPATNPLSPTERLLPMWSPLYTTLHCHKTALLSIRFADPQHFCFFAWLATIKAGLAAPSQTCPHN
jgi:hypothetical protein